MLKKMTIRNFKAIQDLTIEFTPLTVLIGGNSCGKTSILQSFDFLSSMAFRDIPEYLREKNWTFTEIKSQLPGMQDKPIEFKTEWDFIINKEMETLVWEISVDTQKNRNGDNQKEKYSIKEKITRQSDNKIILYYPEEKNAGNMYARPIDQLNIQSSLLKFVAGTSINTNEIDKLSQYLSDSFYFELLSPEKMRLGKNDINTHDIGAGGEVLFSYIDSLKKEDKEKLKQLVSGLIEVDTTIKVNNRKSKAELVIEEKTKKGVSIIRDRHISDGLLRIIAFVAISLKEKTNGFYLIDEIENGINPYLTEKIINLLRGVIKNNNRQIIITTHSPVMLNAFDPDEIIFLWKDNNGIIHSKKFFDTDEMKDTLEFLNPGEVWLNYSKEELLKRMKSNEGAE
jgi:predicted ATPase